jgi:hypothetical protein
LHQSAHFRDGFVHDSLAGVGERLEIARLTEELRDRYCPQRRVDAIVLKPG